MSTPRTPVLAQFLLAASAWGARFLFIKIALEGLSPGQVVLGRLVIGAVTLGLLSAVTRRRLPAGRVVWGHLAVMAVLHCVAPAAAAMNYGMLVGVPERARTEIELWANDLRELPVMPLTPHTRAPEFRLEADASASAAAAIFTDLGSSTEIERIHRELSRAERRKSSTLRELLGYANAVRVISQRHGTRLQGRLVEIVGDSQAAEAIFRKGGSQRADIDSGELELFEAFLDITRTATEAGFDVAFR